MADAPADELFGLPDPNEEGLSKNEKKRRLKAIAKAKAAAVRCWVPGAAVCAGGCLRRVCATGQAEEGAGPRQEEEPRQEG